METTGTFKEVGNKRYITYKEYDINNPKDYRVCILKVESPECVALIKNGVYQTKLILEKGKRHYCPYHTPYGMFTLGIYTNIVDFKFFEGEGQLSIKYSIDINSSYAGTNCVTVKIKKKDG